MTNTAYLYNQHCKEDTEGVEPEKKMMDDEESTVK